MTCGGQLSRLGGLNRETTMTKRDTVAPFFAIEALSAMARQ